MYSIYIFEVSNAQHLHCNFLESIEVKYPETEIINVPEQSLSSSFFTFFQNNHIEV